MTPVGTIIVFKHVLDDKTDYPPLFVYFNATLRPDVPSDGHNGGTTLFGNQVSMLSSYGVVLWSSMYNSGEFSAYETSFKTKKDYFGVGLP